MRINHYDKYKSNSAYKAVLARIESSAQNFNLPPLKHSDNIQGLRMDGLLKTKSLQYTDESYRGGNYTFAFLEFKNKAGQKVKDVIAFIIDGKKFTKTVKHTKNPNTIGPDGRYVSKNKTKVSNLKEIISKRK